MAVDRQPGNANYGVHSCRFHMSDICRLVDTHRLKYFLRVAEEGSITRAAKLLGIAQPALSRQVQLLEEDLGISLFTRNRRGVELTEEGERLRASTAAPLRQLELAVQYVSSPLARLELKTVLPLLLERLPGLRPAGDFEREPVFFARGFRRLVVEWDV